MGGDMKNFELIDIFMTNKVIRNSDQPHLPLATYTEPIYWSCHWLMIRAYFRGSEFRTACLLNSDQW